MRTKVKEQIYKVSKMFENREIYKDRGVKVGEGKTIRHICFSVRK